MPSDHTLRRDTLSPLQLYLNALFSDAEIICYCNSRLFGQPRAPLCVIGKGGGGLADRLTLSGSAFSLRILISNSVSESLKIPGPMKAGLLQDDCRFDTCWGELVETGIKRESLVAVAHVLGEISASTV